jgi:hypothetical protein
MGNNPIAVFVNGELHLNVQVDEAHDTVWLNEKEMAQLIWSQPASDFKTHFMAFIAQKSSIKISTSAKFAPIEVENSRVIPKQESSLLQP